MGDPYGIDRLPGESPREYLERRHRLLIKTHLQSREWEEHLGLDPNYLTDQDDSDDEDSPLDELFEDGSPGSNRATPRLELTLQLRFVDQYSQFSLYPGSNDMEVDLGYINLKE